MSRAKELALAVALDVAIGEPPTVVHPVVWMGRLADTLERRLPAPGARGDVLAGGLAWGAGVVVCAGVGVAAGRAPWPVRGVLLWPLFAGRMLATEVYAVEGALTSAGPDALDAGRAQVARLVSRPTDTLDADEVRMAAIESLAENLSDSVVGPLWWWSVGGLPAAAAYRWIDTLDSRWGYRTPEWERRGRVAARADDAANLVPSRLTALLLRGRLDGVLRREAARTASPNAGWPMAAMALALDVRLGKREHYELHPAGRAPDDASVGDALRRAVVAMGLAVVLVGAVASVSERRSDARRRSDRAGRR